MYETDTQQLQRRGMKKRTPLKLIVALAVLTTLLVIPAERALACSCAPFDPRDALNSSDGAFNGTFQESHPTDPPVTSSDEDTIYTFTVDEAFKGEFGPVAEVHSAADGASCGLEIPPGEQAGLFLFKDESGNWNSNLCSMIPAQDLADAAAALPDPNGQGPPAFLWGGSLGDVRTISFDDQGRILGYGLGDGDVQRLGVCPDGGFALEAFSPMWPARSRVALRDLSSMDEVWNIEIPLRNRSYPQAIDLLCADDGATTYAFFTNYKDGKPTGHLFRLSDDEATEVFTGPAFEGTFVEDGLIVAGGKHGTRLSRVDVATGDKEFLAKVPSLMTHAELDPSGTKLIALADNDETHPTMLVRIDVARARVVTKRIERPFGLAHWWGSDKVVLVGYYPARSATYDAARLTKLDTVEFGGGPAAIVGDRIFGTIGTGWLRTAFRSASLDTGEVSTLFEVLSPVSYVMEPIP
jgi:hypothetical protein